MTTLFVIFCIVAPLLGLLFVFAFARAAARADRALESLARSDGYPGELP